MGMKGIGHSQFSRICTEIDEHVRHSLAHPIKDDWSYLRLEPTYVKVREAGWIVRVAVTIAVGDNADGQREVPSMAVGRCKTEPCWLEFLRILKRRGLASVLRQRDCEELYLGQRRGVPAPNDRMNAYPMLAWRSFARLGRLQRLTANRATWISFVSGRALDAGQSSS
jgi:hypothetical protein